MNKRSLRAFGFGMLFAISISGSYYVFTVKNAADKQTITDAKEIIKQEGFIVMSEAEYTELQSKLAQKEKEVLEEDEPDNTEKENKEQAEKNENQDQSYQLHIVSGMNISLISEQLQKEKMIDESQKFETYLIDNGYHTKIQVGIFEIKNTMDYKEIAELITK
jgi:hypothetical protein